jgi:RND superfamily putative drug exporter
VTAFAATVRKRPSAVGLPGDGTAATKTTQRQAYDLISAGFGPGLNGPLTVVVTVRDCG